jgi:CRISPR type IV-associated protein Csf1
MEHGGHFFMNKGLHTCVSHFIFEHYGSYAIDRFASHIVPTTGDVCAYCGNAFNRMVLIKRLEMGRYTDWHLHKDRRSMYFCLPCAYILRTDEFRRQAVIASKAGIQFLQHRSPADRKALVKSIFFSPPEPPFVISIPTDYRKHILLRSSLNYSKSEYHVQFGEEAVAVAPAVHQTVFQAVHALYQAGRTEAQIQRKSYLADDLWEEVIAPWRHSSLLSLALELAKQMDEELEG